MANSIYLAQLLPLKLIYVHTFVCMYQSGAHSVRAITLSVTYDISPSSAMLTYLVSLCWPFCVDFSFLQFFLYLYFHNLCRNFDNTATTSIREQIMCSSAFFWVGLFWIFFIWFSTGNAHKGAFVTYVAQRDIEMSQCVCRVRCYVELMCELWNHIEILKFSFYFNINFGICGWKAIFSVFFSEQILRLRFII